jgi:hypothetical protein
MNIPFEILAIIFEYDGRIKYKNGKYVNIIHKNDERYNMITPIINKKIKIMKTIKLSYHYGLGFSFMVPFKICNNIAGLFYNYNYYRENKFEISYINWTKKDIRQKRIYL